MEFKDKNYDEIKRLFTMDYHMMSMVSDAIYNKNRYAYNVTFVIIEINPPCNEVCEKADTLIRQTDNFYKINNQYCLIAYKHADFENAKLAFDNFKVGILNTLDSYRYTLVSLEDYLDIDTSKIMDILASTLSESDIVYPKK